MGNAATVNLPYDILESIDNLQCLHWKINKGLKKDEKEDVTIFRFDKSQEENLSLALRCISKLRTLKHPFILKYVDSTDLGETLVLVTEPCIPLEHWFKDKFIECSSSIDDGELFQEIIWGLQCLIDAISFLHFNCKLTHGYLGIHSIFVTQNGDWKLSSFELSSNFEVEQEKLFYFSKLKINSQNYLAPEFREGRFEQIVNNGPSDIYALGRIVKEIFKIITIPPSEREFRSMDENKIISEYQVLPPSIQKIINKMILKDASKRPNASQLLKTTLFNTEYSKIQKELGDLMLLSPSESSAILMRLSINIKMITLSVASHKLLPNIAKILEVSIANFSNRDSREFSRQIIQSCLNLLSTMGETKRMNENCFTKNCLPSICSLWSMSDRVVRTALLMNLRNLVTYIPVSIINKSIFDHLISGFADSNSKLREETLKNLVYIVDKLDEKNLQEKLIRSIVKLQSDSEASIRTNATIFLGRIAISLKENVRLKILCSTFAKALRDNFTHCRIAGLKASVACVLFLDKSQIVSTLLPLVCTLLLDRSSEVRELSLTFIDASLSILRENHLKMKMNEIENFKDSENAVDSDNKNFNSITSTSYLLSGASAALGSGWNFWSSQVDTLSKIVENDVPTNPNLNYNQTDSCAFSEKKNQGQIESEQIEAQYQQSQSPHIEKSKLRSLIPNESWDFDELDGDFTFSEDENSTATKNIHLSEETLIENTSGQIELKNGTFKSKTEISTTSKHKASKAQVIKLKVDKNESWDDF